MYRGAADLADAGVGAADQVPPPEAAHRRQEPLLPPGRRHRAAQADHGRGQAPQSGEVCLFFIHGYLNIYV